MKMKALDMLRDRYSAEGAKKRGGKEMAPRDDTLVVELVGDKGYDALEDSGMSDKMKEKEKKDPEIRSAENPPEGDMAEHGEGEKLREMARKRLSRKTSGNKVIDMGSPY